MSGIVPINVWNKIGFECCAQDTQCEYTSECTNHSSAGDYRMEYGMQPLLTIVDTDKMFLRCQTKDSPVAESDDPYRKEPTICYGYGEILSLEEVNNISLFSEEVWKGKYTPPDLADRSAHIKRAYQYVNPNDQM